MDKYSKLQVNLHCSPIVLTPEKLKVFLLEKRLKTAISSALSQN